MTISPIQPVRDDYVTKGEFGEFKVEMRAFRMESSDLKEEMYIFKSDVLKRFDAIDVRLGSHDARLVSIDKRLDMLSKSLSGFREEVPRYMRMQREGFQSDLKEALEFLHHGVENNLQA